MKILEEVTDWGDYAVLNHTYFTDDGKSKIYAYVKQGTDIVVEFAKPVRFDIRGRKFKAIPNVWDFSPKEDLSTANKSWVVKGSKGDSYTVLEENGKYSCSCSGFIFRGKCRHIIDVANQTL